MIEDEYGLKDILLSEGVDAEKVLPLLEEQLDKVCGDYLQNREQIRKGAFVEARCHIMMAMNNAEDKGEDILREGITSVLDVIAPTKYTSRKGKL